MPPLLLVVKVHLLVLCAVRTPAPNGGEAGPRCLLLLSGVVSPVPGPLQVLKCAVRRLRRPAPNAGKAKPRGLLLLFDVVSPRPAYAEWMPPGHGERLLFVGPSSSGLLQRAPRANCLPLGASPLLVLNDAPEYFWCGRRPGEVYGDDGAALPGPPTIAAGAQLSLCCRV